MEHLVKSGEGLPFQNRRAGGFLALHFEPGFRLMYATLNITAEHLRETYITGER
jgi:hypothetical protein